MDDEPFVREYRLRARRLVVLMVVMGGFCFAVLGPFINDGSRAAGARWGTAALYCAVLGLWWLLLRRSGTFVGPSGVEVRGMVRRTRVPWPDVEGFQSLANPSARKDNYAPKTLAYVLRADGGRTQMMYLDSAHVDVDREIAALRRARERRWRTDPRRLAATGSAASEPADRFLR
jgi:hypothetical protein